MIKFLSQQEVDDIVSNLKKDIEANLVIAKLRGKSLYINTVSTSTMSRDYITKEYRVSEVREDNWILVYTQTYVAGSTKKIYIGDIVRYYIM